MTAAEHNRTLGILFLVYAGLQILGLIFGGIMMIGGMGMAFAQSRPGDGLPIGLITIFVLVMLVFAAILIIPVLLAGLKMRKEHPSARGWGIAASIISLLNFPLGTILGIYGLWFLFGDLGRQYYLGGMNPSQNAYPPPPPNSWQ